jgi:hypothetical protein
MTADRNYCFTLTESRTAGPCPRAETKKADALPDLHRLLIALDLDDMLEMHGHALVFKNNGFRIIRKGEPQLGSVNDFLCEPNALDLVPLVPSHFVLILLNLLVTMPSLLKVQLNVVDPSMQFSRSH